MNVDLAASTERHLRRFARSIARVTGLPDSDALRLAAESMTTSWDVEATAVVSTVFAYNVALGCQSLRGHRLDGCW